MGASLLRGGGYKGTSALRSAPVPILSSLHHHRVPRTLSTSSLPTFIRVSDNMNRIALKNLSRADVQALAKVCPPAARWLNPRACD